MAMPATAESPRPVGPMAPRAVPGHAPDRASSSDTWTLELEPVDGERLDVAPGQFTMLYAFGIGEVPISVSRRAGGPLVHTVRAVGPSAQAICASRPGDVLGVRGPFGNALAGARPQSAADVVDRRGRDRARAAAPGRATQVLARRARVRRRWPCSTAAARRQTSLYREELQRLRGAVRPRRSTSPSTAAEGGWRGQGRRRPEADRQRAASTRLRPWRSSAGRRS